MLNNEKEKIEIQNFKRDFFTKFNELENDNRNILNEYVNYSLFKFNMENIDNDLVDKILEDKEKCNKFDELLEIHNYIMSSKEPFDLLGQLLMGAHKRGTKHYKGNKNNGQFFTDSTITDFISEISLIRMIASNIRDEKEVKSIKVLEPSSGTGSMIISMTKHIKNKEFYKDNYNFTAVEYDYETSLCLLLQMLLLKINVKVVHGDSIKKEIFQQWNIETYYF